MKVRKIPGALDVKRTIETNRNNKKKNKKMKNSMKTNTKSNEKTNVKMNMIMNMNGDIGDGKSFMIF
jgi:hypothetical protein